MPWSATSMRLLPSISKGLVTTATVRMPSSLRDCATTGAAPVPVPPPMPAVMNSMSAAVDHLDDAVAILHRGLAADLRIRAGAETLGDVAADLQERLHLGVLERLRIGVDADEVHALDAGVDHVRDGVAAAAADADDLDDCALAVGVHQLEHERSPLLMRCRSRLLPRLFALDAPNLSAHQKFP